MEHYDTIFSTTLVIGNNYLLYTDKKSVIDNLQALDKYRTAALKTVLHPEWDVLSALHNALQVFPNSPILQWVRSHQDNKTLTNKKQT